MLWLSTLALASPWPELSPPPPVGGGEADAALVVAIDDYFVVPDLHGAQANGEAWYDWFVDGRGVPAENVRWLRGPEATAEAIEAAASEVGRAAGPDGQSWLVFVGHGAAAPDGDPLLLGVDAQPTAASLQARGVRRSELVAALGAARARPVLVLDSCFSGLTPDGEALVRGLQPVVPAWADEGTAEATVLTAASDLQVAGPLPADPRPAFSYLLLGALQGWGDADDDGVVTAAEAVDWTRSALGTTLVDRQQHPARFGPDRPLARSGARPPVDLSGVVRARQPAAPPAPPDPLPPLPAPVEVSGVDDLRAEAILTRARSVEAAPGATAHGVHRAWCQAAADLPPGPWVADAEARCAAWSERVDAAQARSEASWKAYDAVRMLVETEGVDTARKLEVTRGFVDTWAPVRGRDDVLVAAVVDAQRRLDRGRPAELPERWRLHHRRTDHSAWYWSWESDVVNHMVAPLSAGIAATPSGSVGVDAQVLTQLTVSALEISLLRTTGMLDGSGVVVGFAAGFAPFTHRPSRREAGELRGSVVNPIVGAAYRGGGTTAGDRAGLGWFEAYAANHVFVTNHLGLRLEARWPLVSTAADTPTETLGPTFVVAPVVNVAGGG